MAAANARSKWREQFALPEGVYLYSHAVGCLPHVARLGAEEYFAHWAMRGGDAWDPWLGEVQRFNSAIAKLLNAGVTEISPQVNLSSALTKIIQALPQRAGRNRVVLSLLDFPTIGFVAKQAERLGYEIVFVGEGLAPSRSAQFGNNNELSTAGDPPVALTDPRLAAIDERTALVIWTHAYPNTGTAVEPPTREQLQGAHLCVDIAQSAGVIPIDVTRWDADFVIGSCVKWLCGGAGAGFMWVRPDLVQQLEPIDVGWFSHARPFEFDITSFEYAPDSGRFWGGTPSILPYAVAARSVELINGIGVAAIREHNLALSQQLIDAAQAKGITVVSPIGVADCQSAYSPVGESMAFTNNSGDDAQSISGQAVRCPGQSGTVVLDLDWDAKEKLAAAGVHCDRRKFGLRLSPHIYNTADEMVTVAGLL